MSQQAGMGGINPGGMFEEAALGGDDMILADPDTS